MDLKTNPTLLPTPGSYPLTLVDIGNTKVAWIRWADVAAPPQSLSISTSAWLQSSDPVATLQRTWSDAGWPRLDKKFWGNIWVSSVVPAAIAPLQAALPPGSALHVLSSNSPWSFEISLPHPSAVGTDRLCGIEGFLKNFPHSSGMVLHLGTATTVNAVVCESKNLESISVPRFVGGWILPGLGIMNHALTSQTALLPPSHYERAWKSVESSALRWGTHTAEAIDLGIHYGYFEMLRGLIQKGRTLLPPGAQVIATGGNAKLAQSWIEKNLPEVDAVLPNLIWDGMLELSKKAPF